MTTGMRAADRVRTVAGIEVRLEPVVDPDRLGTAWRSLESRSDPSFFQSWGWIGCWLRHLLPDRRPLVAIAMREAQVLGLGVVVPGRERRYGIFLTRTLRLHESGDAHLDSLCIEHNGILADRDHAAEVWAALLASALHHDTWNEVVLGGLAPSTAVACIQAARAHNLEVVVRERRSSAYFNLERLRQQRRTFVATLSRNTRHQLLRARRLYEEVGPLGLREARSADEALAMLDQLKILHQQAWRRRGRPGCFAAPAFEAFHRDLIRDRFHHGEIRLLCASAGDRPFGYLYNFAHGDRIYAYQSGFDYTADGRLKPGLVSHALAIEQALGEGFAVYDFMAGDNRLKASFASDRDDMLWLAIRHPSMRSWLQKQLGEMHARETCNSGHDQAPAPARAEP